MASGSKDWIEGAVKHPGAFKAKAEDHHMSTSQYASKVKSGKVTASRTTKRQAQLASEFAKFRKEK